MWRMALLFFWGMFLLSLPLGATPIVSDKMKEELVEANFIIVPRPNYAGSFWIIDQADNNIVGYAPWDKIKRRWTLFNLRGDYQGFIQANTGSDDPPHYTQYLWYDKNNAYKGVFVASLGGRPTTPDLPYGEIGGNLNYYAKGNIPVQPPTYEIETDPLKLFHEGIEVDPLPLLPGR
jgi:hypothetical protein